MVMTDRGTDIMNVSETHWTGHGKVLQLTGGESIFYSGRDGDYHREGVGTLMLMEGLFKPDLILNMLH